MAFSELLDVDLNIDRDIFRNKFFLVFLTGDRWKLYFFLFHFYFGGVFKGHRVFVELTFIKEWVFAGELLP